MATNNGLAQGVTSQVHTKEKTTLLGGTVHAHGMKTTRSGGTSTDTHSNARTDELYEPTGASKPYAGNG